MALPLSKLPIELLRELRRYRWAAVGLFALVSFAVLAVAFLYPYQYRSEVVIFVDDSNIIRPLMEGSAEITGISDQASSARELLWSRRVLEKVVEDERIFGSDVGDMSMERREALYSRLRNNINVSPQGKSYMTIRYQGEDPRESYLIAQRLGQLFLEETNRRKRAESRNAYDFIDKQVKSYERQIKQTEQELKEFRSRNLDGTEQDVNQRISQIRRNIESAELELEEAQARERSLEAQLTALPQQGSGGGSIAARPGEDTLTKRIENLEERLDELRLTYHDSYPDVVSLENQIAELKERRRNRGSLPAEPMEPIDSGQAGFNPVQQELQTALSKARTEQESLKTRINSLQRRLGNEEQRMERIQANRTELAELTRDLQVNEEIFNDLLKRRERARVSMHLDIEGQGLSYQVHEQARFPMNPTGLEFQTFASVGWILGLLAPFGLLAGLLQIDPRVRSVEQIQQDLDIPLLGSVPPVKTPYERRREKRGYFGIALAVIVVGAGYAGVVFLQATGVLA